MTDQLLEIFKFALLGLLYLFFARVLWAVWSEVRGPRTGRAALESADMHGIGERVDMGQSDPSDPTRPATVPPAPLRAKRRPRGAITKLVVLQPRERKGATFPIVNEITIGRASTCTIMILDDSFVSQIHARLQQAEGSTWVEDLRSTNGSYLNGAPLTDKQPITKGDRLQIGSTIFEAI